MSFNDKNKVLYIGHFLENSGYSEAAKNYVHSMYCAGINVVCRNIKLNTSQGETSDLIKYLLGKDASNFTHVINHTLPHHWCYTSSAKNIGMYIYDTSECHYEWAKNLNMMDEIWTPTAYVLKSINRKYVKTNNVKIVPHAVDVTKFSKKYQQPFIPEINGTYKFYYIGESNKRKNIFDTIKAFHQEFDRNEPVSLIIKTSIPGLSPEESGRIISEECNKIKMETRRYNAVEKYIPEIIITERLSDDQINGIHQYCDCYVSTSRGEAWNQPLFDAYGFGNDAIRYTSKSVEMYPYLSKNDNGSILVDEEPCFGYNAPFPFVGTANENWLRSDVFMVQGCMRFFFDLWQGSRYLNNKEKISRLSEVDKYSYSSIGKLIKGLL